MGRGNLPAGAREDRGLAKEVAGAGGQGRKQPGPGGKWSLPGKGKLCLLGAGVTSVCGTASGKGGGITRQSRGGTRAGGTETSKGHLGSGEGSVK